MGLSGPHFAGLHFEWGAASAPSQSLFVTLSVNVLGFQKAVGLLAGCQGKALTEFH
jgi:hypothetical protein